MFQVGIIWHLVNLIHLVDLFFFIGLINLIDNFSEASFTCSKNQLWICFRCSVASCSQEHLSLHHRDSTKCFPYRFLLSYSHIPYFGVGLLSPNIHLTLRVCQTEGEGNYLVASRDIAAGEVLITLLLHLGCIAKLNVLFFGLYMFVNWPKTLNSDTQPDFFWRLSKIDDFEMHTELYLCRGIGSVFFLFKKF